MEFNKRPLTRLAKEFAEAIGAEAPLQADKGGIPEISQMIKSKLADGEKIDRMLIFNPDAIGEWFYNKYKPMFKEVDEVTDLSLSYITAFPPKTPVCFGTMFTGATPDVHGITKYTKPVIKIDSVFDAWARAGLKVALVSVAGQSIPKIFAERAIDYYLLPYDKEVVNKALELIAEDKYDVIEVYNQEFDDIMHATHPESKRSMLAAEHYVASYKALTDAVKEHWSGHNTFVAFATDHGTHRMYKFFGLGAHGKNIPNDMNIRHFYGVIPKKA